MTWHTQIALGAVYVSFVLSVVLVRWRRTKESWEYVKRVGSSCEGGTPCQLVGLDVVVAWDGAGCMVR